MATNVDSSEKFDNLSSKITNLVHGRTETDRSILSKTLDELNSLNYRYSVVANPIKAALLINQCCNFISTDDDVLVQKYSQLLWNLVSRQSISIEGRTLTVAVKWCLNGLNSQDKNVLLALLQVLDVLLRLNIDHVLLLTDKVWYEIIRIIEESENKWAPEVTLSALKCLEACTSTPTDKSKCDHDYLEKCANVFLLHLKSQKCIEDLIQIKILQVCLFGLQNIVLQCPDYLNKELGTILGIIKTFMVYGIKGIEYIPPQKLMPSTLSIPETPLVVGAVKGGKLTKKRKQRPAGPKKDKKEPNEEVIFDTKHSGYCPATTCLDYNSDSGINVSMGNKFKTSDSDFSDNEINKSNKIIQVQGKVRQAACNLFYNVIKNTERYTMFSYWTSFIPEGTVSGPHNLVVCILKDPSSQCRMAALSVLLLLLNSSKLYLSQAENSDKSTSFTPFSVILGLMIKELHKGLCLALIETSVPVLTQLLKCLGALVRATPYHKMSGGLVTKIVRNVKPFIYHKDVSVQVTALIVLGCILASEPLVPETKEIMLRKTLNEINPQLNDSGTEEKNMDNIEYAEFSDSDDEGMESESVPWLLQKCLGNLGVKFENDESTSQEKKNVTSAVPVPVKLESLQVISAVTRNYFEVLIAPYLPLITKGLNIALADKSADLKLHAGRAVDSIGQAIDRYITNKDIRNLFPIGIFVTFWQTLLNGSLINLLQSEEAVLKTVGCDCLGSIGSDIFIQLPRDKQILCVTLLFSCTRDEENNVKGAAVRALAICVMYSSLREDSGFVVDTAEAICRTLQDQNLMVRIKASWSLGNLSDALVLNNNNDGGLEEMPEDLILKLLQLSINCSSNNNDKIKMNAVRALGNLIQVVNLSLLQNPKFGSVIEQAFDSLVKNSTVGSSMKVRWNACYALGSSLKNPNLYEETTNLKKNWQISIFKALTDLVVSFKNFKVRINAALSLSCPSKREHYGEFFFSSYTALLEALENSENTEDFNEYKHRDHLIEQVCLSLGHLTTLLRKDDLLELLDTINLYFDTFRIHTQKVLKRLVPEKSNALVTANFTLNNLSDIDDLDPREKLVLTLLKNVFAQII